MDTKLGAGNPEAVKYSLGHAEPATSMSEADARKLLSDVLREEGYIYSAQKVLDCPEHNIRIGTAIKAILRAATSTPK